MAERGFYGTTVQEVADRVGLSQAGLLKYVKNKSGLLSLALKYYDGSSSAQEYVDKHLQMSEAELHEDPLLLPRWYRIIAEDNVKSPKLTQMYLVLRAEAIDTSHPAHTYFSERGTRLRSQIGKLPWKLPSEFDTEEKIGMLSMAVGSAMEGLELRWLGEPNIDLLSNWSYYEDILFPLPHWEGYR
ncbi:helix-turn-helix domain-containing protein [Bifidobacterium tsurumiense]|uniref:Transcriptional regulator n=1 Tax=Bifidobacterium tsurumiense TaxID=356829 RepID=A0A087EH91_9BIFI|nr:TetR/AcrR family transcriptional regulator [Bifidobacterium tsurumiense]KFJ07142.1 transcriptional regulator [Bifidobacterium tsurumiense]MDY4677470.1 helix-turn-helix domain-containing protein [Bifidobacterium tsurumiense]MSS11899.1 helix-turn-helix transcriptional regulator [Bifidobacterium tsurumiense]